MAHVLDNAQAVRHAFHKSSNAMSTVTSREMEDHVAAPPNGGCLWQVAQTNQRVGDGWQSPPCLMSGDAHTQRCTDTNTRQGLWKYTKKVQLCAQSGPKQWAHASALCSFAHCTRDTQINVAQHGWRMLWLTQCRGNGGPMNAQRAASSTQ